MTNYPDARTLEQAWKTFTGGPMPCTDSAKEIALDSFPIRERQMHMNCGHPVVAPLGWRPENNTCRHGVVLSGECAECATMRPDLKDRRREARKEQAEGDSTFHPKHYNMGKFEVIDVIDDWKLDFCLGNAIKYIARAPFKGKQREDLRKAIEYLELKLERLPAEEKENG